MKTAHLLFLLLPLLLLCSCKKKDEKHTSAKGTVIDATTQQPVPYAKVALVRKVRDLFATGYSLVDGIQTGADGKYSFNFEADEDYHYYLFAEADRYLLMMDYIGIDSGKKNSKNLQLQPEAYLKAHIIRKTPPGTFLLFHLLIPNDGTQPGTNREQVDTTITRPVYGNKSNKVEWVIYDKNSNPTLYSQFVYCPAHDTTTFTIEY